MIPTKTLKIGFVSSSDFCIPIANELLKLQGKSFNDLINNHQIELNKREYIIDGNNFKVKQPHDYQDVKTLLGETNNWKFEIVIVVSQPDNVNRNKIAPSPIAIWAVENNIELWKPKNINKETSEIFDQLDLVVTASFGQIISQNLLDKPKYGFINWHPSLLPKYRGPTPMQSTIFNRDSNYGLSWISMTKAMDAGKVLIQLENELKPSVDFEAMATHLGQLGSQTLSLAILNQVLEIGIEQNQDQVVFCQKIEKDDQLIQIEVLTASQVLSHQKAFIRFPGTVFVDEYFGKVKIIDCSILDLGIIEGFQLESYKNWNVSKISKRQIVYIECANKTFLQIIKIKTNTGKLIDLSGYQFI